MRIVLSGPLTDDERAALEGGEPHPFGTDGEELEWRPKDRHVMVRDEDGTPRASTGLLVVEVSAGDGEPFEVVGLGGVIVAPAHRGEGLARTVVEAALETAAAMGPAFAMLFCREAVRGLYAKLGFLPVPRPVEVQQPGGTAIMSQHTMWRSLHEGATWPAGPVRMRSLPF
jgi:predicted N-acetyltransferase YhbS